MADSKNGTWRWLVLIASVVVLNMSRKHSQPVSKHPDTNPKQDSSQEKSTNRHVYIEPGAKIDFVEDLKKKYNSNQSDDTAHKAKQLFWTRVASVLILLTASFAGWQGYSSKRSADAAASAAMAARQSLESVQRAFINYHETKADRMKHRPASNSTHYWKISVVLENSGTTPAVGARVSYHGRSDSFGEEPTEEIFRGPKTDISPPITIGPKAFQDIGPDLTDEILIFGKDFDDTFTNLTIMGPQPHTFLWGWMIYRDVFPGTAIHLTEFCRMLGPITFVPDSIHKTPQVNFMWASCREHNCTDEYCNDYKQITDFAQSLIK